MVEIYIFHFQNGLMLLIKKEKLILKILFFGQKCFNNRKLNFGVTSMYFVHLSYKD